MVRYKTNKSLNYTQQVVYCNSEILQGQKVCSKNNLHESHHLLLTSYTACANVRVRFIKNKKHTTLTI